MVSCSSLTSNRSTGLCVTLTGQQLRGLESLTLMFQPVSWMKRYSNFPDGGSNFTPNNSAKDTRSNQLNIEGRIIAGAASVRCLLFMGQLFAALRYERNYPTRHRQRLRRS